MSNWKSLLIGIRKDGSATVVSGPEDTTDAQRNALAAMREAGELPDGLVQVDFVTRSGGVQKSCVPNRAETPEEKANREVRGMTHDAIVEELEKPTAAQKKDKAKAEKALVAQRLGGS